MEKIRVWTKQNKEVLQELEATGRYITKREYILKDLEEHSELVLEVYDWLVKNGPKKSLKPVDVEYPIWLSFKQETTMLPSDNTIILELEIDSSLITMININKWGKILNYSYIPKDKQDAIRHRELLKAYGVSSDAKVYMSQFYPQLKQEIISSWHRLFDESILIEDNAMYGNIWEVRKEWIKKII